MRSRRFTLSFLPVLAVSSLAAHHAQASRPAGLGTTAGRTMVRLGVDRLAVSPGVPTVLAALAEPTLPSAAPVAPGARSVPTPAARPPVPPPATHALVPLPATAPDPVGPRPPAGAGPDRAAPSTTTTTTGPVSPSATVWAALRRCESGGDYAADTGNGYYGAYQFSLTTWHWLGYAGFPNLAPPATQDAAAARLEGLRGWSQWPACSRALGLR